jgi:hypothetical protein
MTDVDQTPSDGITGTAESIHAYRHRIDHLTFTDLPRDEQHGVTARIQRQAEQDLQEQLQKQNRRY